MDAQELQRLKNKYDIIGNDAALNRALEMAVAVAPTDLTVLVTGESGVGKDNIPKIIHQFGRRKNAKYFAVNCGAIPEGTIDSELFGHEKGSFTGAIEARKGYFEEADGGTLFLDEIGELPLPSQAKLLRVLQSGEYKGGLFQSQQDGCKGNRRHERESALCSISGEIQGGPLLQAQCHSDIHAGPEGAQGGHLSAVQEVHVRFLGKVRDEQSDIDPRCYRTPHELQVAGQHSPAEKCRRDCVRARRTEACAGNGKV